MHLLHQALHAPGLQESVRGLGLRIDLMHLAVEGHQAGDLLLLVLIVVDPRSATWRARSQAAAIDLDSDHLGRAGHAWRQLAAAALDRLVVALSGQLGTHLLGEVQTKWTLR